jgi:preprotein translocase subunit SecD
VTNPTITGHSNSVDEAKQEIDRFTILLKSGKLPVSVSIGSISTISPTLGSSFLTYSLYAGIVAMVVVTVCVFFRYRKPKVALPIMMTLVFEVTMILGVAALIGWQMDLPSVAGVLAAVGTGIDDQIIIADEVLRKRKAEEEELSIAGKIKKAFSIIFMAAGTHIFSMLPLLFIGIVVLKGFAITTIVGVIVGVFVTRPAYAAIVDKLM